jgi:hypothetical protein
LAGAAEFDLGGGRLGVKGNVTVGTVVRADGREAELLPAANAALVGATGIAPGGKNQDDGNLNFDRGDAVSTALKAMLELHYKQGDWGVLGRVHAWHDFALKDGDRPFGNLPNGLTAEQPLSDRGFTRRSKFAGVDAGELYAYGNLGLGRVSTRWKAGQFFLDWGSRFTIPGGLADLSPRDNPARLRAGALPEETRVPVPALSAQVSLTPATTLDAFIQLAFRANVANGCGTFFSQVDFVADGCDKALLGQVSDRGSLANGVFVKRAGNEMPGDGGQFGLGLRHKFDPVGIEAGAYAAVYHSRMPYFSAIKSQRTTNPPFVPGDPGGLNPQYFVEYPESIKVFGLTLEKKLPAGAALLELTYRPNQPYQYNAVDLLTAFSTAAGPTPLRAAATATPAGDVFRGYERHKAVQLNIAAFHGLPGILGARVTTVAGEIAYKNAPDLPDPSVARFRRPDVYGQAPVGAAPCPTTASAKTCSLDGYVTKDALAYRLRVGLRYPQLVQGVDFQPSLSFGHDVKGWSDDGAISEGRQFAILSLKATVAKAWQAELTWQPTWGGAYNNMKDRSVYSFALGYAF